MNSTEKAELQEEEIEIIEGENPNADDDDDGEGQEDQRLSENRNEDEDARREAKRSERQRRKQGQKFARDKTREEMQWLIQQNQQLQERLVSIENQTLHFQKGSLDQDYNKALGGVQHAEDMLAKAIEIGDGARVPELLRQRDRALAEAAHINRTKQQFSAAPAPRNETAVNMKARQWAAENPWFNPDSNDPDSAVAKAVDASLVSEGLDPATDRYWEELDRRVAKYLPQHFADDGESGYTQPQRTGRRGPPVGGSRDMTPGSRKVYISSDRVQALKEAGLWDDPVARQRMLKRYAEQDRLDRAAR